MENKMKWSTAVIACICFWCLVALIVAPQVHPVGSILVLTGAVSSIVFLGLTFLNKK